MSDLGEQGVVDAAEVVEIRDAAGRFLPGNGLAAVPRARESGSAGLFVLDVQESYDDLGGVSYLAGLGLNDPRAYVALLARVIGPELKVMLLAQQTEADRTVLEIRDYAGVEPDDEGGCSQDGVPERCQ